MRASPSRPAAVPFALVASGCAALMYESAWGRMLHRVFGVSDWAVATVVAAFFLGMGLGAMVASRFVDRIPSPARAYAGLELGIAGYAILSTQLVPRLDGLYAYLGPDPSFAKASVLRLGLALAVLLPPTLAMGATLPILLRTFEHDQRFGEKANGYYALNTFGAALGAGLTGFVTLPLLGCSGTLLLAALFSTLAAFLGASAGADETLPPLRFARFQHAAPSVPPLILPLLAFSSGLLALGGEVLFTRMLRLVIQGSSQAFAAMLSTYLVGIVLGTAIARRVSPERSLAAFGALQLLASLAVLTGIRCAPLIPRIVGLLRGEPELVPHEPWVMLTISALTLLPIATLVGTGLPCVLGMIEGDHRSGRLGRVLGANTLGGLVGSMTAGFVAVPFAGLEASLLLLAAGHGVLALVALASDAGDHLPSRIRALTAVGIVAVAGAVLRPSLELPFLLDAWNTPTEAIVRGASSYDRTQVVFVREGRNTTVSVLDRESSLRLFNDGRPESGIVSGRPAFGPELTLLGGLPAVLSGHRNRALVVGLGAGHSTTMALDGGFRRVDVVELEAAVVEAAHTIHRLRAQPYPLDDRRAHLIVDDARVRLALARPDSYDAVISQPSHPWLAGASALYTEEFFEEVKRALRDDGTFALWTNVFRMDLARLRDITSTLTRVFPNVMAFVVEDSSFILVASERPFDLGRVRNRLDQTPKLRERFADYELDTAPALLATMELDTFGARRFGVGGHRLVDDIPRLEYALTRLPHGTSLTKRMLDGAFMEYPWLAPETIEGIPADQRVNVLLHRLSRVEPRRGAIERVAKTLEEVPLDASDRDLLRGAVAEMLGAMSTALALYDESESPEAAARADSLRWVEISATDSVRVALPRTTLPADANDLIRAALELADPAVARSVLAIADRTPAAEDASLLTYVRAYAERGCAGVRAILRGEGALDVARLRIRLFCAADGGHAPSIAAAANELAIAQRAVAQTWYRRGEQSFDGGNLALAARFFRRAIATWPAHRDAALKLAETLCALDRCEDAAVTVGLVTRELRYSPEQANELRRDVEALGVHPR